MRKTSKPNLFIVGAPKAGTTFLYEKLIIHPDIFFPKLKELNYFSIEDLKGSYYKDYQCRNIDDYLKHYKVAENQKYIVDASVSYFISENAIEKIKAFNSSAQIIISIRNPIKRAFSHYQMDQRMGYAPENFEFYISSKDSFHYKQYVENSLYFKHISEYIASFGRENVHVVILEEIENDTIQLFDALKLEKKYLGNIDYSKKVNENKKPKNGLGKVFQQNRNFASKVKLLIPKKIITRFKPLFYKEAEKVEISNKEMDLLRSLLNYDIKNLEHLLKRDLKSLWNI